MEVHTQEARILLAIEAIQSSKKISRRSAAKIYRVPYTTLSKRIAGIAPRDKSRPNYSKLLKLEEEVIIRYILNLDSRGFTPRLTSVEDITNYILESRGGKRVSKLWVHRFV